MGNNPSKNDLPNTSANSTSGGASSGVNAGELDADESSLPLSRPTGFGRHINYHGSSNRTQDDSMMNIKSSPQSIPAPKTSQRRLKKHSPSSRQYEFDIDASMAILLASQSGSPFSSLKWRDSSQQVHEYGSSTESLRSADLSISPVFTSSGENKDESLLLSESLVNSPVYVKGDAFQNPSETSLDPIVEASSESTPEPKKPMISTKKSVSKKTSTDMSSPIPKSHIKDTWPRQKTSSEESHSPPLIPMNKKLDIDLDGVINRLLAIGMKKDTNGSSKSRKNREKLPLTTQEIKFILAKSRSIFMDQPTLLKLSPPVKIVGDIHGQFHDLIRIFNSCGYPPYTNYLFLGDYVDRGHRSLETILLLLCYKIKYPENFFMLRGNHESANITKIYGFYDECKRRLPLISGSHKLWKNFVDVFNTLPLAATINDKIFCIHGGLSPDLHNMRQIEQIQRPTDIPDKGLLADLLWSDPDPLVKSFSLTNWPKNDRGVSYCFGKKHVDYFLSTFKMDLIVRGHMVVEDGYEFFNKRKLVTVFLAPNYCGEFNNYGAVMNVDKSLCCSFELLKPQ